MPCSHLLQLKRKEEGEKNKKLIKRQVENAKFATLSLVSECVIPCHAMRYNA